MTEVNQASDKKQKPTTRQEKNLQNLAKVAKKVAQKQEREAELKKEIATDVKKAEAVVRSAPTAKPVAPKKKGLWAKFADGAGKAWNWLKDGGWTDILSVGATLLNQDSHLDYSAIEGTLIPKGTILYSGYISPETFHDTNLYTKSSLFTYYEFFNTFITVEGLTGGDNATGALGVFINPDPSQDIHTSNPDAIISMVANFNGAICRLDRTTRCFVPPPEDPLHVNGNDQLDLRLTKQGQLYIIAYTDLNTATASANVKLNYNCDFAKDSNPVFRPLRQHLLCANFSNTMQSATPTNFSRIMATTPWYTISQVGSWAKNNNGNLTLPAGTYKVDGVWFATTKNLSTSTNVCTLGMGLQIDTVSNINFASAQWTTNMRGMASGEAFPTPTTGVSYMFTIPQQFSIRAYLFLTYATMDWSSVRIDGATINFNITPMVLYDVSQGDTVNSALLCKHHPVLPDYILKRKDKRKTVAQEPKVVELLESSDKGDDLSEVDQIRISNILRKRRLSAVSE